MRTLVRAGVRVGLVGEWFDRLISNLLLGGVAWADAEKAKLLTQPMHDAAALAGIMLPPQPNTSPYKLP